MNGVSSEGGNPAASLAAKVANARKTGAINSQAPIPELPAAFQRGSGISKVRAFL
jgi:hypothetical protein